MSADDPAGLNDAARMIAGQLADIPDVTDIDNGLPLPGVDWELQIDRGEAARYGVSPSSLGSVVQLVTTGLRLSDFRPAGSDDAVDIVLRLPPDQRTISALDQLRIETDLGSVPISNFVTRVAAPTSGILTRIDGSRTVTIQAGIREGVQAQPVRDAVTAMLNDTFAAQGLTAAGLRWTMAGEDEEQAQAGAFLAKAFGAAIFLIFVVLLAQFNRFISVGLVLSAVVMSTIGVFLGLMIMGQPFGVVMTGIGVIALAGVVVNNNIVLIATYDQLRDAGMNKIEAILETCRERARPVVLTALTAIFGVLPIAFGLNLELMNHETTMGAPSTQWWISLSSAIVYGLAFATILTLIVTPSMLMLVTRGDGRRVKRAGWFRRTLRAIWPFGRTRSGGQPAE
jgi:multidrug efflux pump